MAHDSLVEQITNTIISNCCKNKNIYICDEDIENHCEIHENKKECVNMVKSELMNYNIKFTTWD